MCLQRLHIEPLIVVVGNSFQNPWGWPDVQGLVDITVVAPLKGNRCGQRPQPCCPNCSQTSWGPWRRCLEPVSPLKDGKRGSHYGCTQSPGETTCPFGARLGAPTPDPHQPLLLLDGISEISLCADITRTGKVKPTRAVKDQVPLTQTLLS